MGSSTVMLLPIRLLNMRGKELEKERLILHHMMSVRASTSAYLAVCASGTVLFVYFSEELGQTLFLCLSHKHLILLTTY